MAMPLDKALTGMFNAEAQLRTPEGINNPTVMSEQMMRLSQYAGAIDEHIAELERDFKFETAVELKLRLIDRKPPLKVTQAEREVDIIMAQTEGQIKYLTRLSKSAWDQIGVIQSRINHLIREMDLGRHIM